MIVGASQTMQAEKRLHPDDAPCMSRGGFSAGWCGVSASRCLTQRGIGAGHNTGSVSDSPLGSSAKVPKLYSVPFAYVWEFANRSRIEFVIFSGTQPTVSAIRNSQSRGFVAEVFISGSLSA